MSIPKNTPCRATNAVTKRYKRFDGVRVKTDPNTVKLRALMKMFGLTPAIVARHGRVSRPYVARLISEHDDFSGSHEFYRKIEACLGRLIENRTRQLFDIEVVPAEGAEQVLRLIQ